MIFKFFGHLLQENSEKPKMKNSILPILFLSAFMSCATTRPAYYSPPADHAETEAEKAIEYPYSIWAECGSRFCRIEFESADTLTVFFPHVGKFETERYSYYVSKALFSAGTPASRREPFCGVQLRVRNIDRGWQGHLEMSVRGHGDFLVRTIRDRNRWMLKECHDKTYIKKLVQGDGHTKERIPSFAIYNRDEDECHSHKFGE